jgi:hypothetical protein
MDISSMEVYEAVRALPIHKAARHEEIPIKMFQTLW